MTRLRLGSFAALAVLTACVVLTTCRDSQAPRTSTERATPPSASLATSQGPATLVGAGNIAKCGVTGAAATAALLDSIPGTVFAAGDAAYDNGTLTQYQQCYQPSWGLHKARTQPTPGERDYKTANAAGYFSYFGAAAGDPKQGYYSYDLGTWHIIVLNSGSSSLVPTTATSPQVQWLRADLAAHPARCTLAYWHHPLFDSKDNPNANIRPLWDVLYGAGVDVVVNAHYAFYERFAPQTPAGVADSAQGIREFIVGTGGAETGGFGTVRPNSQVRNSGTPGVLKLTLDDGSYAWQFVPIAGKTFSDSGSGSCHGAPPVVSAGPDVTTNPLDTIQLAVNFTDPDPNDAPWAYTIGWGDGTTSTGSAASQATPISATHAYSALGLYSVRVTVTNSGGGSGADTVAVHVVAPSVLVGAGDIADCTKNGDSLTANLMDTIPGTVMAVGDNAYPDGTSADYKNCYNPTWGRFKARTKPVPGNHDYITTNASGYFNYFGAAAGASGKGYYSYDLGDWHVVALNSNITMNVGSPQEVWLRADLAKSTKRCTLAYMHHPLFSSGNEGAHIETRPLWVDLYNAGAELVIVGHDHDYERFAPQSPTGVADSIRGIREIVVGTGGGGLFDVKAPVPNSERLENHTLGVLKLTLHTASYSWKFLPVAGKTFGDSGSTACHDAPSAVNHAPTAVPGGPYSGLAGSAVAFNGTGSSDPDGDAFSYAWSFGDGATGTGATPIHVYATPGTYTVTLTVTDTRGLASPPAATTATIATAGGFVVLVGAGDIATCGDGNDELTAQNLDTIPGTVVALGDNVFPDGTLTTYQNCYDPSWGRHKARTYAALGNHEYATGMADGSFDYFGDRAGPRGLGYYSFDVGAWHVIVLNSNGTYVPFNAGSAQDQWLQGDLAANSKKCTLAFWHVPRFFSSNTPGFTSSGPIKAIWNRLYAAGADVVLNAQQHHYERFAPMNPAGLVDPAYGIKEFNVGTGGEGLATTDTVVAANSEVLAFAFGVLKLTLYADRYTWQFVPMRGETFSDVGSGTCHDAPVNRPPTAAPGGPYGAAEGTVISFDGSGSTDLDGDALTYAWDFGDGTTGTGVKPSHTYADNGSYTVTLTVTDAQGATSSPATTTASITNVAPAVNAGPNQNINPGSTYTLNATFGDPGPLDGPWAFSIDWGDGSPATTGSVTSQASAMTGAHTYPTAGSYTLRVTVTDKDGGAGSGQLTLTVSAVNSPPKAVAGGPYTGTEGTAVSFDGSGSSDPDGDALTYAWTFGDGSSGTGVRPAHAYADNGTYSVTLTVTDARGSASSPSSTTATIANAAPSVFAGANQTATTGSPFTISATFSDRGVNDGPWAYSIDWGDGSAATTGSATSQSTAISATHTYTAPGTNTVRVTVSDKDGSAGSGQLTVTVTQVVTTVTLVGAGNIARCDRTGDEATAAILDTIPGTVFALGDAAFPGGLLSAYQNCYDPSWGRQKGRTVPVPGNRDYDSSATAAGYFAYFGGAAGDPTKGYYSFDLGAWHIIMLNSNSTYVSTAAGSPQGTWLRADLAATTKQCVLAMFHRPRFYSTDSTSTFSPTSSVKAFWDTLYAYHAELIINAHMRDYERFAPQTPTGAPDPVNGIREIIVGTGGEGQDLPNTQIVPNSEVNISGVFGVLKLTLGDGTYAWQFIPVPGQTPTGQTAPEPGGSGSCH